VIIDFGSQDADAKRLSHRFMGWRCFIDDAEIHQVWYVDTIEGFVRSYNALGDGKHHTAHDCIGWPPDAELIGESGVLSITVRGALRMQPPDEVRAGVAAIVTPWPLIDGTEDILDRVKRLATWSQQNGGLNPAEERVSRTMIECLIARGVGFMEEVPAPAPEAVN
jgi:hypothetical protein